MFGRKKKEIKKVKRVELRSVPLPVLMRQAVYDTMLEPAESIASALGLPPISNEVAEMEEDASQKRLERFAGLIPYIDSHSSLAARIATCAFLLEDEEEGNAQAINSDDPEVLADLFKIVAISSTISCLSSLFDLGLLETKVGSHDEE